MSVVGDNIVQSPNGKNVAASAVRICLLFLLVSSALLLTGCATANMSSDDRATFYKGWVDPNSSPSSSN